MPSLLDFDPAGLGVDMAPGGGARIGGLLGAAWWRPYPDVVAELRGLTSFPHERPPPMPRLPAGNVSDPACRAELESQAVLAWRAVRHRRDYPKVVAKAKPWAPRQLREVVGAINVWKPGAASDLSLWALAAVRWDGLEGYFQARPRKPVAVLGRAVGLDLSNARAAQRTWESWALPKTTSERELVAVREAVLARMRAARPETPEAARAMMDSYRDRCVLLRSKAVEERTARKADLDAAVARGDWIWTCRRQTSPT